MKYELRNLSVGYGDEPVVSGINATLHEGELCALIGPNGAGKSTLLRTMAAFQPAISGELWLNDIDVRTSTPLSLSRHIGVVLTERVSGMGITVRDLVEMGRSPYTNFWGKLTEEDQLVVSRALDMVGISELADRQASTLSDGERQKVMIAKALAQETPIILLDEPTAYLDFPSKVETMLLLRRLCREMGKSVLLSTHDLSLALQVTDSLWLLSRDGTLSAGTPQTLGQSGALNAVFRSPHVEFDTTTLQFRVK
ncbi:MAG: ABC transporter ATP-binding protein [Prevotellaceae bacterium]|nr:ABC transporter ATP-binding protein [Prevotellaceae bacterium]